MAPATEIATIPLSAGATIEDPSSPAGKVWQSTLDTVASQDGFQRLYYGREVENPTVAQLFVDWDSVEAHKKFIASSAYGPFGKHLMTIVDGPITMLHAHLDPHPPSAALSSTSSPVTEVITAYFSQQNSYYASNFLQAAKAVEQKPESGFKGKSGGWVEEDVESEKLGDGKKGKAFVGLFGWESVEAHMKFRETQEFKDNIHLLRDGTAGMEVHHTSFIEK